MLLAYSFVSGETIAGSSNRSNLNVIQSGPEALFGFRALIFLDTNSSEIEKEEIVCTGVPLLLMHCLLCTTAGEFLKWMKSQFPLLRRKHSTGCLFVETKNKRFITSLNWSNMPSSLKIDRFWETFQYAAVDFADFMFSQKNLFFARLRSPVISFLTFL